MLGLVVGLSVLSGCSGGAPSTPEDALEAIASAVTAHDDEAMSSLVCAKVKAEPHKTFAAAKAELAKADPRLEAYAHKATAVGVTKKQGDRATGTIRIVVEGIPADPTPEATQLLEDVSRLLIDQVRTGEDTIALIREGEGWVACD